MWDHRYGGSDYAYGTEPNDFLVSMIDKISVGDMLCLGEGEGRNAVWLAQQGRTVTAVDASELGLEKARKLAELRGVSISTIHADLADFNMGDRKWKAIISIFCHLPPDLRRTVHQRCVEGLQPGGVMLLEAYTPRQLEFGTGGPPNVEMMMDAQSLRREFIPLEFPILRECVREVREGEFHDGEAAVVQMLAVKPQDRNNGS